MPSGWRSWRRSRTRSATRVADRGPALTDGFRAAFLAGAGFAFLGLIVALMLIKTSDSKAMIDREAAERVGA